MAEITIRISDKTLKIVSAVLAAVILLWGFTRLWSLGVFEPKYQIQLFLPATSGLQDGALVRLDGMDVGKVSRVKLAADATDSARRVEVVLRIEKRFQNMIREDSSASVASEGLLGSGYINIARGFTGPPINSGQEIRVSTVKEVSFTDLIGNIGKMADCLNEEKRAPDDKMKWIHIAEPVFQREKLNLDKYNVSVADEGDSVMVSLSSLDSVPGARGSTGTQPGYVVVINKKNLKVLHSYFVR